MEHVHRSLSVTRASSPGGVINGVCAVPVLRLTTSRADADHLLSQDRTMQCLSIAR